MLGGGKAPPIPGRHSRLRAAARLMAGAAKDRYFLKVDTWEPPEGWMPRGWWLRTWGVPRPQRLRSRRAPRCTEVVVDPGNGLVRLF